MKTADEKAIEIHTRLTKELERLVAERDALKKRIAELEVRSVSERRAWMAWNLGGAQDTLRVTKEDLELTRSNYEGQLKLLSEHLISQNERVAQKEQELERLRQVHSPLPCHYTFLIGAIDTVA